MRATIRLLFLSSRKQFTRIKKIRAEYENIHANPLLFKIDGKIFKRSVIQITYGFILQTNYTLWIIYHGYLFSGIDILYTENQYHILY